MKIHKFLFAFFTLIFCILGFSNYVNAENNNANIPFNMNAIHPSNQINKSTSYIDALYKPGETQQLQVKVRNSSSATQHFIVSINDATTSNGLAIDYTKSKQKLIRSPKISELVDGNANQAITMPGKSSKVVTFDLSMPKENFKGIIMGGISVYKDDRYYQQSNNDNKGVSINNKFVYSTAVLLRNQNGNVLPDLKMVDAKQAPANDAPAIVTTLKNDKRNFISGVKTNSTIKDSNGKKVAESSTSLGQIAPISQFDLSTPLKETLSPGDYTLDGNASASDGQKWDWHKSIHITQQNFDNTQKNIVTNKKPFPWAMVIIISLIAIILILIGLLIYLLLKRRNKDNKEYK
ncbi:DUF916 and DUF3324 domain-containing protein [Apilactobacillus timberlakei]|uniref:DUF916 domain-containing protein n=1 Tax=Apilactobacillus timberlakei TaxID=2008380 RepID=UPI001126BE01|nr:DUF916 domain-containing protein [Apilactobacillus timberlakei]TPR17604.1 DUF916 and DUF3324 domain-containing protein [Apilactobacillus timberlakei]TPR19417.1 DUF916 and DUF3324 domain-containing protein [Apilactobacillus timberlakei]TPR20795.1 DUF916 and DUF3324 domain-containing protein [Apilactobacillus timberlakei]